MRCPECKSSDLQVIDSRETPEAVRRRRLCARGHRFTTYERHDVFKCPRCGGDDARIEQVAARNGSIDRRRRCGQCGLTYNTVERFALTELAVIKSDGRREPFNRDKLFQSLRTASIKRQVRVEDIQTAVDEIESGLHESRRAEVDSQEIARLAMECLLPLDDVAYVRYASGYVEAGGIDGMLEVIGETSRLRELDRIRRTNLQLVPDEMEPAGSP